jgi:hypothetical protein
MKRPPFSPPSGKNGKQWRIPISIIERGVRQEGKDLKMQGGECEMRNSQGKDISLLGIFIPLSRGSHLRG